METIAQITQGQPRQHTQLITFWKQLVAFEQDQENFQSIETINMLKPATTSHIHS